MKRIIHDACDKFRIVCVYCGCEFEYDLDDVHDKYEPFVKCPNCDTHNVHDATVNEKDRVIEAITEFAERLKDKVTMFCFGSERNEGYVHIKHIDRIAEEIKGGE